MRPSIGNWSALLLSFLALNAAAYPANLQNDQGSKTASKPVPSPTPGSLPPPLGSNMTNAPHHGGGYSSDGGYMSTAATGLRNVMYFTNWGIYGRNFQPQDLAPLADSYTHILYSFANVKSDTGEVVLSDTYADLEKHYPTDSWNDVGTNVYGCVKQLFLLKKKYRKMKVLLSIGGWTYSSNFAAPMATAAGRQTFVTSAVKLLEDLGFDGIDIDWEYPADSTQAANFVSLLQLLRSALDTAQAKRGSGTRFVITAAVAAGPSHYQQYDVAGMNKYLDLWNLMAYDYAGSWDSTAGHQANLNKDTSNPASTPFNTNDAINYYTSHGVSANKIVLGMPLYGRAFESTDGPGKPFNGVGAGSWENGIWDYKALPKAGATEQMNANVGASWSYDASKREMISYDTPAMVKNKASWLTGKGLGGGMWWEASGDKPKGAGSLVETFINSVGGSGNLDTTQNCLSYPSSKYDNMKAGFPGN